MTHRTLNQQHYISANNRTPIVTLPHVNNQDALVDTLVALANSSGATLLIGVDDESIHGVEDSKQVVNALIEAMLTTDPPLIVSMPRIITVDDAAGTSLVVLDIPPGLPHVYAHTGRYLQRKDAANAPLKPPALRRLLLERGAVDFETQVAHGTTLDDLNWEKARAYATQLKGFNTDDVQQVLLKRGCLKAIDDDSNTLRPTNAGILLFGNAPQQHLIGSDITAARFAGDNMGDTFSRQDIGGTLPEQITRAETFLVDHLRKQVALNTRMKHDAHYEYPMEAARELVINAVAHRDYSIRGDNIRLFIYSDRMEVHSPGSLPGPMTVQNLKDQRFSRNPVIVQVLADMNFIEKLGYGVDRVMELMRSQNLQAPSFDERANGFHVILHNAAIKPLAVDDDAPEPTIANSPTTADDTDTAIPPVTTKPVPTPSAAPIIIEGKYKGHEINERQEGALEYLHQPDHTRITNSDLKALYPDVHPETIRRDLVDLVDKGVLLKMGQKRGSYYVLKQATDKDPNTENESETSTS